jgi:hypothetical protein
MLLRNILHLGVNSFTFEEEIATRYKAHCNQYKAQAHYSQYGSREEEGPVFLFVFIHMSLQVPLLTFVPTPSKLEIAGHDPAGTVVILVVSHVLCQNLDITLLAGGIHIVGWVEGSC